MSRVDGEMAQTSDQTSESTVVKALTRNLSQKVPTILIVGKYSESAAPCVRLVAHA